jgi:hypothetical protein
MWREGGRRVGGMSEDDMREKVRRKVGKCGMGR